MGLWTQSMPERIHTKNLPRHLKETQIPDSLDSLSDCARRVTDAYTTGIEISAQLRTGNMLASSIAGSSIRTEILDDAYPEWHPASYSFLGMVRLLI